MKYIVEYPSYQNLKKKNLDRKYDGVDTDWIDLKSNNYFSNEVNVLMKMSY